MRRMLALLVPTLVALALSAPASAQVSTSLKWAACADDASFDCTTATLPLNYEDSNDDRTYEVFLRRKKASDPATRIGTLFTNPGGPGASGASFLRNAFPIFAALSGRYDIIGFDPRGTGQSQRPIDCKVNQETQGLYSVPFPRFDTVESFIGRLRDYRRACTSRNGLARYFTTANVARDLDNLRRLVGDSKLHYLGYSYGTYLGATYARLFPNRIGRMVLDGPVDATSYANDPLGNLGAQTAGFEDGLGRFAAACGRDQRACLGFGGDDPLEAIDELIDRANENPIPAPRFTPDPRPVTGDDIATALLFNLYAKQFWPFLAQELSEAAAGDASIIRADVDAYYGNNFDGTFSPGGDRYFVLGAIDWQNPTMAETRREGRRALAQYPHFWDNAGYTGAAYVDYPSLPDQSFRGPFRLPDSASTPLVVATTHDPATPYPGAKAMVHDVRNARLLTMSGDGHTAYPGNSPCIDEKVNAYLLTGVLPPAKTRCKQDVPFAQTTNLTAAAQTTYKVAHAKPVP